MFWDFLNTIWLFLENICLHLCLQNFVDTVSQELMGGNWWFLIFICILYNLMMVHIGAWFWCISLKNFRWCSKFLISLTQWYRTKLSVIVPNTNYFKPIILKYKTFIYVSNNETVHNFCIYGNNVQNTFPGEIFLTLVVCERTPQNKQN